MEKTSARYTSFPTLALSRWMQIYKDSLVGKAALAGAECGIGKATAKLLAFAGVRVGVLTNPITGAEVLIDGGESLLQG